MLEMRLRRQNTAGEDPGTQSSRVQRQASSQSIPAHKRQSSKYEAGTGGTHNGLARSMAMALAGLFRGVDTQYSTQQRDGWSSSAEAAAITRLLLLLRRESPKTPATHRSLASFDFPVKGDHCIQKYDSRHPRYMHGLPRPTTCGQAPLHTITSTALGESC